MLSFCTTVPLQVDNQLPGHHQKLSVCVDSNVNLVNFKMDYRVMMVAFVWSKLCTHFTKRYGCLLKCSPVTF